MEGSTPTRLTSRVTVPSASASTQASISVELCNECHPFYTGKQKLVDTGGRIDRFERRYGRRNK